LVKLCQNMYNVYPTNDVWYKTKRQWSPQADERLALGGFGASASHGVPLYSPALTGSHRDGQAELTWVAGCIQRRSVNNGHSSKCSSLLDNHHCSCSTDRQTATMQYLVGWLSGRTSVSDRRTFTGLHRTCSCWVTIYMGKPSTVGQPTRPTQPFILTGSINE